MSSGVDRRELTDNICHKKSTDFLKGVLFFEVKELLNYFVFSRY